MDNSYNSIDLIIVYSSFVLFGDGCPSSLSIAPTPVVKKQANVKTALHTLYDCTGVVMRVKQHVCCYDVHRGMCVATVYTGGTNTCKNAEEKVQYIIQGIYRKLKVTHLNPTSVS